MHVKVITFCRWIAAVVACAAVVSGCSRAANSLPDVQVTLAATPSPLGIGPATITVRLADTAGAAINGASVDLEASMSHAGMESVHASARETAPGQYSALVQLGMDGDWFVVVQATLPDGRTLERELPLGTVHS